MIAGLGAEHWAQVRAIYAAGIASGDATFTVEPPQWAEWDAGHLPRHRFVEVGDDGTVLGWAAVSATSKREVYAGVVEVSIYVAPEHQGSGVGRRLLQTLIASTEADGIWTLQAGIFPENLASIRLHESAGFEVLGVHRKLGRQGHRWRDVVRMERRSTVI